MVEQFEPGVFTVTLTPTDADALGVKAAVHFTATPCKCWVEGRYEDGLRIEAHDEPAEPERQALAFRFGMDNPAGAALDLLIHALLTDERRDD
jgi:hypothetical protein